MGVGRDRGDLRVGDCDLGVVGGELEVLLVLLWAVVPAREREDQGVLALDLAELSSNALVIGQLVVGEGAAGGDVAAHGSVLSKLRSGVIGAFRPVYIEPSQSAPRAPGKGAIAKSSHMPRATTSLAATDAPQRVRGAARPRWCRR